MTEIHEFSSDAAGPALFGFAPRHLASTDLEDRVREQFVRLFGTPPFELIVQRWWTEGHTTPKGPEAPRLLGHPFLRRPLLGGRLHLASCESSGTSPGHLDGAVERAEHVARTLIDALGTR